MNDDEIKDILTDIQIDLAGVKNDITWLKRIFTGSILIVGSIFGIDMTGMI